MYNFTLSLNKMDTISIYQVKVFGWEEIQTINLGEHRSNNWSWWWSLKR